MSNRTDKLFVDGKPARPVQPEVGGREAGSRPGFVTGDLAINITDQQVVKLTSDRLEYPGWVDGFNGFYNIEREDGSLGLIADYLLHRLDMHDEWVQAFNKRQLDRSDKGSFVAFSEEQGE